MVSSHASDIVLAHELQRLDRLGTLSDEVSNMHEHILLLVVVELVEELVELLERAVDVADEEDSVVRLVQVEVVGRHGRVEVVVRVVVCDYEGREKTRSAEGVWVRKV